MIKRRIVFRADGNSQIGLGHVMRSLALADMLKDDFLCVFAIQNPSEAVGEQIKTICDHIFVLPSTNKYLDEASHVVKQIITVDDIVVLDGYYFNTDYQTIIKNNGNKLVCIDDIHAYHFVSDAIINHAGGVNKEAYSYEDYTKLFIGSNYALLRKPFLEAIEEDTHPLNLNKVLICMGGADPNNEINYVLSKVLELEYPVEVNLIIGSAYKYKHQLNEKIEQSSKHTIIVHTDIDSKQVRLLMKGCGVAICTPSTVAYEYCAVQGLLFLYKTADNQKNIFDYLLQVKAAVSFSKWKIYTENRGFSFVQEMQSNQKIIFGGLPLSNIQNIFKTL